MDRKPIEDVIFEINNFISLGGRTIVDATGSESIGRDAQALREVALKTGLNIVASSGPYLEKFESQRIHKTVDELAATIDKELNQGIGDTDIRAGMIGEIGVSPTFTEAEHEGIAPGVQETADAVAHLIELGYADQLVLSHDVFLKQMWAKNGGNGWGFVPDVFLAYLAERGVDKTILKKLCIDNPGRLLTA